MSQKTDDSAETQRLLDEARAGDSSAFGQVLENHRPFLRRVLETRFDAELERRVDVSDVIQDANAEATRRMSDYLRKTPVAFRLWLRQIACDRLLMARRRHVGASKRSKAREVYLSEQSSLQLARRLQTGTATPSQHVSEKELAKRVRRALSELRDSDHEIILMRTFEKLSYHETACILGIDAAAARKRHGRALLQLGKILHEQGLTESQV